MLSLADKNYYIFKGIVIGAKKTGKTTFLRQMANGSPEDNG